MKEKKFNLGSSIKNKVREYELEEGIQEKVVSLCVRNIQNWEFRDRRDFEIGDIEELANDIIRNGQVQPIIVTKSNGVFKSKDGDSNYIVIAGYRRWLACTKAKLNVMAVIRENLTLEKALSMLVSENKKESISDYSKGMFYKTVLDDTNITQANLAADLGLTSTVMKNFLSFSRIEKRVLDEIENPSKISSRTASVIASTCAKGNQYILALIKYSKQIENGVGATKLCKLIDLELLGHNKSNLSAKFIFKNEFSYIKRSGNNLSINHKNMNDDLIDMIKELVEMHG